MRAGGSSSRERQNEGEARIPTDEEGVDEPARITPTRASASAPAEPDREAEDVEAMGQRIARIQVGSLR